jgi:phage-related protein
MIFILTSRTTFGTFVIMETIRIPDFSLSVRFYRTESGAEPVRDWLKSLPHDYKKEIGEDIKTVQFGWPVGMPVVRKLDAGLWEVRSHVKNGIARVIFTIYDDTMILLHGFIKKSQKTPTDELETAKRRKSNL